jgi:hypothetical protein
MGMAGWLDGCSEIFVFLALFAVFLRKDQIVGSVSKDGMGWS